MHAQLSPPVVPVGTGDLAPLVGRLASLAREASQTVMGPAHAADANYLATVLSDHSVELSAILNSARPADGPGTRSRTPGAPSRNAALTIVSITPTMLGQNAEDGHRAVIHGAFCSNILV